MKNALFLLVGLALSAQAAPIQSHLIRGNIGQSIPLFGSQPNTEPSLASVVNLTIEEIDTSKYFYQITDKPVVGTLDTVGYVHFAFKDSSGTDSARVRLIWYGNARADGGGLWVKIDSVTAATSGAPASAYAAGTPTPVINSKGYAALMFTVSNPSSSAAALKSVAKDIVLNRRARIGSYQP